MMGVRRGLAGGGRLAKVVEVTALAAASPGTCGGSHGGRRAVTTPAQAAARAENGRLHSTGPKSPQGKKASSMNALKHGGYAGSPVIPRGPLAEDAESYDTFKSGVLASFNTEGPVEDELADRIASLLWRGRRPAAYEAIHLADAPMSPPAAHLAHANWAQAWNRTAARVLRDPTRPQAHAELEHAAVAAGHAAGLVMDDLWPQPRPRTTSEWNELIDSTLAAVNTDREQAALSCDREIKRLEGEPVRALADLHVAEVTRLLEGDLLLKTSRVESHLSRELSRHLLLLRTLQADRKARTDPA